MLSFYYLATLILGVSGPFPSATLQSQAGPEGFRRSIFDGQSLAGWRVLTCDAEVKDGNLVIRSGNGLVVADHRYRDFVLEWTCRPERDQKWDSGIYFRAELPDEGKPWPRRYQVNLKQGEEGNLVGSRTAIGNHLIRPGHWNQFRLTVIGQRATLDINDQRAWSVDTIESEEGHVAIQVEVPGGGAFEFKDLFITEVGYEALFNGTDLAGWEGAGSDAARCWSVDEGRLRCDGMSGPWLRSTREFGDFNLRLEYQLEKGGNSGVYVRVPKDGNHHGTGAGVEIQLLDDDADRYADLKPYQYSASLYAIAPASERVSAEAGTWNSLEIDCRGDHYRVVHNGHVVVDANAESFPDLAARLKAGYFGFQNHKTNVWFRNVRIEL